MLHCEVWLTGMLFKDQSTCLKWIILLTFQTVLQKQFHKNTFINCLILFWTFITSLWNTQAHGLRSSLALSCLKVYWKCPNFLKLEWFKMLQILQNCLHLCVSNLLHHFLFKFKNKFSERTRTPIWWGRPIRISHPRFRCTANLLTDAQKERKNTPAIIYRPIGLCIRHVTLHKLREQLSETTVLQDEA